MADEERERGGGDDGMRETEGGVRAREGLTIPEVFFSDGAGQGGDQPLNSSPPLCSLSLYSSLLQGSHYGRLTGHED